MRAKKSNLRVFKLRSGEEVIARVSGKPRGKITVQRPMLINHSLVADPFTGAKKNVVYITDWIGSATELHVDIPKDFIVMELTPDPDMERLYTTQLESQDEFTRPTVKIEPEPEDPLHNLHKDSFMPTEEELRKLDALMEAMGFGPPDEKENDKKPEKQMPPLPPAFPFPPSPPAQRGVILTINIPSELVNEWVQSGIMDYLKDCMEDFLESEMADYFNPPPPPKKKKKTAISKEKQSKDAWKPPTEEDSKKPEYGNNYNDWSPYLKDYISGCTGENSPKDG